MRSRTRLTTPPGEEPASPAVEPTAYDEAYSPGFPLPLEPIVLSRWHWPLMSAAITILVLSSVWLVLRLGSATQAQDPSLAPQTPVTSPEPSDDGGTGSG